MIFKLEYKKTITFLTIGFMIVVVLLWYKQQTTNKIIPKKASFVLNTIEWSKNYG